MTLVQKIKSYFLTYGFHSWNAMDWNDYGLYFQEPDGNALLDISRYLRDHLQEAETPGNDSLRLNLKKAQSSASLDQLIATVREVLESDYRATRPESLDYDWDFRYVMDFDPRCGETIRISTAIKAAKNRNCVYALLAIRKSGGCYYCWKPGQNSHSHETILQ